VWQKKKEKNKKKIQLIKNFMKIFSKKYQKELKILKILFSQS